MSSFTFNLADVADSEGQERVGSVEQLVKAAVEGDRAAFGTLVESHWNMAVALALTRSADPAEAEDIAQESFVRAYANLRHLREPSRFSGWLSRIVVQQCSDSARKALRRRRLLGDVRVPLEDLEAMPVHSANPGLTDSQIESVQRAVRKLPERFRQLLVMRFVGGLTSVEIARQLGARPGTVRIWLHRAFQRVRRELEPLFEEMSR